MGLLVVDEATFLPCMFLTMNSAATAPCWSSRPQVRNTFPLLSPVLGSGIGGAGIGGSRRDLLDGVFLVDAGGQDRHGRIEVADHPGHAVADELVGDGNACLDRTRRRRRSTSASCRARRRRCVDVLDRLFGCIFNCAPKAAAPPVIGPPMPGLTCANRARKTSAALAPRRPGPVLHLPSPLCAARFGFGQNLNGDFRPNFRRCHAGRNGTFGGDRAAGGRLRALRCAGRKAGQDC